MRPNRNQFDILLENFNAKIYIYQEDLNVYEGGEDVFKRKITSVRLMP